MKLIQLLNYDTTSDSEVFSKTVLDDLRLKIEACTVANSEGKPNEDAYTIVRHDDCLWIGMFDGTTSLKIIPALGDQSGARFASHFLKDAMAKNINDSDLEPKDLLTKLNSLLLDQAIKLGGTLSDTHSLPACLTTIAKLDFKNNLLKFAHIGDTYGIGNNSDGSTFIFTDDKNNKFDQEMFDLMKKISIEKGITIRQARQGDELKKTLYQMFIRRNNNPNGFGSGLVNGDPNAVQYIQSGQFSLDSIQSILIATDGFEIMGKNQNNSTFRQNIFKIINQNGLPGFIKLKKKSEDLDPDWNYPRYKHSDDASAVYVTLV